MPQVSVGVGDQCFGDDVRNLAEGRFAEPARGQGRRADAQPGGDHRRTGVERHSVAVDGDVYRGEAVFGLLAVEFAVAQVHQDQVHVRAAGNYRNPSSSDIWLNQAFGQDPGTGQDA